MEDTYDHEQEFRALAAVLRDFIDGIGRCQFDGGRCLNHQTLGGRTYCPVVFVQLALMLVEASITTLDARST